MCPQVMDIGSSVGHYRHSLGPAVLQSHNGGPDGVIVLFSQPGAQDWRWKGWNGEKARPLNAFPSWFSSQPP